MKIIIEKDGKKTTVNITDPTKEQDRNPEYLAKVKKIVEILTKAEKTASERALDTGNVPQKYKITTRKTKKWKEGTDLNTFEDLFGIGALQKVTKEITAPKYLEAYSTLKGDPPQELLDAVEVTTGRYITKKTAKELKEGDRNGN